MPYAIAKVLIGDPAEQKRQNMFDVIDKILSSLTVRFSSNSRELHACSLLFHTLNRHFHLLFPIFNRPKLAIAVRVLCKLYSFNLELKFGDVFTK